MGVSITETRARSILTRTTGFLKSVCSHSLQPYRGCSFGNALCGVGCYVQHNRYLTRGAAWGGFLEARTNAAEVYRAQYAREQRWGRRARRSFALAQSSDRTREAANKWLAVLDRERARDAATAE